MSSAGQADMLHLRLFIENVEVPVIGALVQATIGSPAVAQIEMVPANSGLHLCARSKVLLFFLAPEGGYKLLFNGEFFSMSYSKSGVGSRSLMLQCLDDSNNWDTSYLYSLNYDSNVQESVFAGRSQAFLGMTDTAAAADDILANPVMLVFDTAQSQQTSSASISGANGNILGGLLSILELIGGVAGRYVGITGWHTIQEARVRLIDQIASDDGKTAGDLFSATAFDTWLNDALGSMGTVVSFRDILTMICQYIYYSVVPNPVGVYRAGSRDPSTAYFSTSSLQSAKDAAALLVDDGIGNKFAPEFVAYPKQILAYLQTVLKWDGASAITLTVKHGTITKTKAQARISSGTRSLAEQAKQYEDKEAGSAPSHSAHVYGYGADFSLTEGIDFGYGDKPDPAGGLHAKLMFWASDSTSLQELYNKTDASGKAVFSDDEVATAAQIVLFYRDLKKATEFVGGGSGSATLVYGAGSVRADPWLSLCGIDTRDAVHVSLAGWQAVLAAKGIKLEGDDTVAAAPAVERERLLTQYFRPDIWFAAAPACNVIFPEEVTSLMFSRDTMRETTRFQMSTYDSVIGSNSVTNVIYFAPVISGEESLTSGGMGTAAKAFIYAHEKFSGIIPKMERISELSFFTAAGIEQAHDPTDEDNGDDTEVGSWARRAAAFSYLSARYDARSLSVSMTFTPRLVPGFPAVVIDRTAAEDSDDTGRVSSAFSPNHFLGMIHSITHSLSQAGGSTSISMSHVRTHKPDFDDSDAVLSVQTTKVGTFSYTIDLTATTPDTPDGTTDPHLYSTNVDLTIEQGVTQGDVLPFLQNLLARAQWADTGGSANFDWNAPTGVFFAGREVTEPITKVDGVTDVLVDGVVLRFPFSKVSFKQANATTYRPIEEAIRPPWMSEDYSNAKIGALYQDLLGCRSIMDIYANLTPGTVTVSVSRDETGEQVREQQQLSEPGVADAVERIVGHYSKVSSGGYLGTSFIRELTSRDYATLGEVIGDEQHPGFYWQSCGNRTGLVGTTSTTDPDRFSWMTGAGGAAPTSRSEPTKTNTVDPKLDPRQERYRRALRYQQELLTHVGIRG